MLVGAEARVINRFKKQINGVAKSACIASKLIRNEAKQVFFDTKQMRNAAKLICFTPWAD
jgi:hypothetical protein